MYGQRLARAVKHGLAVKADHIDIAGGQPFPGQKRLHRPCMQVCEFRFNCTKVTRPLITFLDCLRRLESDFQPLAKLGIKRREG